MNSMRVAAKGGALLSALARKGGGGLAGGGRAAGTTWLHALAGGSSARGSAPSPQPCWAFSRLGAVAGSKDGCAVPWSHVSRQAVLPPRGAFGIRGISTQGGLRDVAAPAGEVEPADEAAEAPAKEGPRKVSRHKAQHHDFPRAFAKGLNIKTSMKKLNLVAKLVRRAHVDSALLQLSLNEKKVSRPVRKLVHEAKFNAVVMGMDPDRLLIDEIRIGRSTYLKRLEIKGRGRTGVRRKPYCHIYVYVREIQPEDEFVYAHLKRKRPRWRRLIAEARETMRQQYTDAPHPGKVPRKSIPLPWN